LTIAASLMTAATGWRQRPITNNSLLKENKTMKQQLKTLSLTIAASLMIAATGLAQQPSTNGSQPMQNMQGMQMHNGKTSMNQMMQGCHKHMQSMIKSNAQTTKDIEAAKQSNDPAKMRAALDEAEKALSPMNEHMQGCMRMMKMMQNMHGKGGMMGMQNNEQKGTPQN
jgi:imidazolonepropionase-like amidohydrolase